MAATGYNLNHLQAATNDGSPTYVDINYATTFEPTISQENDSFRADGQVVITAQGAPEGGGSIGFGSFDTDAFAVLTGGTASSSGSAGTLIDRLEIPADYTAPSVILVAWIPNVDGNSTSAGLRITVPNAKVNMPSTQFGQETWSEFAADISFAADENDVMLIFEDMATAPTFTAGVIPTNLEPPA
jgi:hypothetical protein